MSMALTFTDWENYTDGDAAAHTLDWSTAAAIRGRPAYAYIEALRQAAEARYYVMAGTSAPAIPSALAPVAHAPLGNLAYTVWWIDRLAWAFRVATGTPTGPGQFDAWIRPSAFGDLSGESEDWGPGTNIRLPDAIVLDSEATILAELGDEERFPSPWGPVDQDTPIPHGAPFLVRADWARQCKRIFDEVKRYPATTYANFPADTGEYKSEEAASYAAAVAAYDAASWASGNKVVNTSTYNVFCRYGLDGGGAAPLARGVRRSIEFASPWTEQALSDVYLIARAPEAAWNASYMEWDCPTYGFTAPLDIARVAVAADLETADPVDIGAPSAFDVSAPVSLDAAGWFADWYMVIGDFRTTWPL